MKDDSIEKLLENLKQTLDSKEQSSNQKTSENKHEKHALENVQRVSSSESVFVLKNKEDGAKSFNDNKEKDLLKKSIMHHIENEVVRYVVNFCSSDEGMSYMKALIAKALQDQEEFIKKHIKAEVTEKIQQILSSKD